MVGGGGERGGVGGLWGFFLSFLENMVLNFLEFVHHGEGGCY